MGLKEYVKDFKSRCDAHLKSFFDSRLKEVEHPEAKKALSLLKEFTLRGGKRLRALIFYEGFKCFSKQNLKEVEKASICMELVQSYLLIHDDIIDKDDLRRGGPTIHKSYGSGHFGNSMAILVGDISSALSNQVLSRSKLPSERKVAALTRMNQCVHKVLQGEILDVLQDVNSEGDILEICAMKTASYTIEGPLHVGAALAGASPKDLSTLSNFAIPLGCAFQLLDDIDNIFGDPKSIGKPVCTDIREGKKTLLLFKAIELSSPSEKRFIRKCFNKNLKKSDIDKIRSIVISSGALGYIQDKCKDYAHQAKNALRSANFRTNLLEEVADYIGNKKY